MHICLLIQTRLLFHWMKQYYRIWTHNVAKSNGLKSKHLDDGFVSLKKFNFSFQKTLTDGLEWCGLLVDYCDVFISCLDSF